MIQQNYEVFMNNQYTFNCNTTDLIEHIKNWVYSPELEKIIHAFNGCFPSTLSTLHEHAKWLLTFSERWDYRSLQKQAHDKQTGENARWQISSSDITASQKEALLAGIYPLGLIGTEMPSEKEFDYIIALGGARFSCLYRPKYVHDLIYSYGIKAKAVVLLSGMRPISDSERIATDTYAPHANTEYELINAGAEQTFNLSKNYKEEIYQNENPNKGWAVRTYDIISGMIPVYSVSGPSSEPEKRRANSADTYKFFLDRYNVHKGQKLLLVTSQIYVPYQQLEALRTLALPRGLYIETVGFPVEWASKMQGMMEPANYLQEIRSTIQAVNRYLDAVDY